MKFTLRQGGIWLPLLFCWLPAATAQISPEKVASVVVTNIGPRVVSDDLVRGNIHVKAGDTYIRSSVDQDVLNLYNTGFFSNIQVTDDHTDKGVVVKYILQGKLRLTGITFTGNTKFSTAKLAKKLQSKVGDPMDERKLFNDELEIQKAYEKAGYRNTTVKYVIGNYDYDAGRASVNFEIHETPKIEIVDVEFEGAHAFTQKKLRHVIKTRRHWFLSWLTRSGIFKEDQFQEDREKLADFYRDAGYIDFEIKDVKFSYPTPGTMKIEFFLYEGQPYKVGTITITGNKLFTTGQIIQGLKKQHADSRSKTKIGEHGLEADTGLTFKPGSLEHDIHAIEDFYGARGYINVREGQNLRIVKNPNTETGTMDLEYDIDEGQKVYIEKILIKGNVKTKDKVIRRELAVSPGDVFDMVRIRRSKERLEGLTFFERVETKPSPTEILNHDDLIVGVDEKSTGNFTFGAGFNTIESIFGYAEIEQRDFDLFKPPYFTGAGEKFRLRVQIGAEEQSYLASFVEPWFLDKKLVLGVDLYRTVSDYVSLAQLYNVVRTGTRISLSRALGSDFLIGGVSYNLEQVGIVDVNTNSPNTILAESGYNLVSRFGTSISYDTRNSYQLANKGQLTSLASTISVGDRNNYKLELKSSWFFKGLAPGHVLELAGKAGVTEKLSGQDVPFYDRFYLGGQDSLRGFDFNGVGPRQVTQDGTGYEPVGGDTYWLASAEYTIPIVSHFSFAFFYDIGNVSAEPWSNAGMGVPGRSFSPLNGSASPIQPFPAVQSPYIFNGGNTRSFSDDYGMGIRLDIPNLGPLRLDYGIPIHHDSFNGPSGKFQFGVGFQRPL